MNTLILASGSPRRLEILTQMGLEFEVRPQDVDETFTGRAPADEAMHLAEKKALSYLSAEPAGKAQWVLAADTFISFEEKLMGKAETRKNAAEMLQMLSGRTHQVVTGLALNVPAKGIRTSHCITDVTFAEMSNDEIQWYLDTDEWIGAAAAYRIQEKGALFVESISGSYSNVMGLPINAFYGMLVTDKFNFRN